MGHWLKYNYLSTYRVDCSHIDISLSINLIVCAFLCTKPRSRPSTKSFLVVGHILVPKVS